MYKVFLNIALKKIFSRHMGKYYKVTKKREGAKNSHNFIYSSSVQKPWFVVIILNIIFLSAQL